MTATAVREMLNTPDSWSARAESAATSWEAAGWTESGQRDRFDAVVRHLGERDRIVTLLDYGCGTGALAERLPANYGYLGFDWAPGMLERAREEHPNNMFLDDVDQVAVDYVVAVGTFNLPGSVLRTKVELQRLWQMTREALIVSLYRGDDDRCLRYTPDDLVDVLDLCGCDRYVIDGSYRANDVLLVMRK